MRDQTESGNFGLQYDTEGNLVARLYQNQSGEWMIIPEPDYPLVVMVKTGVIKLWDRKQEKLVKFSRHDQLDTWRRNEH